MTKQSASMIALQLLVTNLTARVRNEKRLRFWIELFAAVAEVVTRNFGRFVGFSAVRTVPFDGNSLLGDELAGVGVVTLWLILLKHLLLSNRVVGPFLDAEQVKGTVALGAAPDFVL